MNETKLSELFVLPLEFFVKKTRKYIQYMCQKMLDNEDKHVDLLIKEEGGNKHYVF